MGAYEMKLSRAGVLGLAFCLPIVTGCLVVLALRQKAVLAPVLGPWAGVAIGHHDCTIARQFPLTSTLLVVLGGALLVASWRARTTRGFPFLVGLAAVWGVAWEVAALFSLANASS